MRPKAMRFVWIVSFAPFAIMARPAAAQDSTAAAALCVGRPCGILFDWGSGKTAADYPVDRRYGAADEFETGIRRTLAAHGSRLQEGQSSAPLMLTIRPRLDMRAMCDIMPGTDTNYGCMAVSEFAVSFTTSDAAVKAPSPLRLTNRCGGDRTYMTMTQFGVFGGEMLWWTMNGQARGDKRPIAKC